MNIPIIISKGKFSLNEFNHHSIIIQKNIILKKTETDRSTVNIRL